MSDSFALPARVRVMTLLKKNNKQSEEYPDEDLQLGTPHPSTVTPKNTRLAVTRLVNGQPTETRTIFYNRINIQTKMSMINPDLEISERPSTIQDVVQSILDDYGILLEEDEIQTDMVITDDNELVINVLQTSLGWLGSVTIFVPAFESILLDSGAPFILDGGRLLANG